MVTIERPDVECLYDGGLHLGESPVWSAVEQALWWVNVENPPQLFRLDHTTGAIATWPLPERVGAIAVKASGGLLVALASGVHDFDPTTAALTMRAPTPGEAALHEGKCDRAGRFWIGAVQDELRLRRRPATSHLYRLDGGRLVEGPGGITVPNSMAFGLDGRSLYAGDGMTGIVHMFDYDEATGATTNRRPFLTIPHDEGMLDGAAIDAEGGYWLALFFGGCIRRYRPDGTLDRQIDLPFVSPTMLAFGGPNLATAYVTSGTYAPKDLTFHAAAGRSQRGGLFRLDLGIGGVPEPMAAL
jgi:sugar lactone lactonase YvrE